MTVGRWIGPGMTVGWHSFTPNGPHTKVRVVRIDYPGVTRKSVAETVEQRELAAKARPLLKVRARVGE